MRLKYGCLSPILEHVVVTQHAFFYPIMCAYTLLSQRKCDFFKYFLLLISMFSVEYMYNFLN